MAISVREPLTQFIKTQLRPNDLVAVMYPLLPEAGAMVDLNAFEEAGRAEAQALIEPIGVAAAQGNVRCELVVRYAPDPWREIVALAEERDCDCIWMASHGRRGLDRLLLGSETQRVLAHTTIPVMVYRQGGRHGID